MKYSNDLMREGDKYVYKMMSENASIPFIEFLVAERFAENYFIAEAYKEWEDLRIG